MSTNRQPESSADDLEAELEAMRNAPYPNPADDDRGGVLMWTGLGMTVMGAGVVAASAICPPCMLGIVPLCAAAAPALVGAGFIKRWRRRRRDIATTSA